MEVHLNDENRHMLVVSNRLPAAVDQDPDGNWKVFPSSGGLVTAMAPVMRRNGGTWIGWPGCPKDAPAEELLREHSEQERFTLKPVPVSEDEVAKYYRGFSNQTIWPLFHDLLGYCEFDADQWETYCAVNRRFAEVTAEAIQGNSPVWVHDYQLLLVGRYLRELGVQNDIDFFLHIPFPSSDLIRRLPWRREIMYALMDYDHIGFQTRHDYRNFMQSVRMFVEDTRVHSKRNHSFVLHNERTIELGIYPISIDFKEFDSGARSQEVADSAWYFRENLRSDKLVLGLDRLDYTKGIPERFLAFERALEKYPELRGHLALVQVVVPSRVTVPQYQGLKEQLDQLAGRINGRFSTDRWIPIHYMFRHLNRNQLLGYYKASEIALITPLRDGMNLVAKEYCAASIENNGVLILSEFAGAADQLAHGALMVNPYDLERAADAIFAAYIMDDEEKTRRMKALRSEVRRNDVHKWLRQFMEKETRRHRPSQT
jgi:trehalose 6-phosphate synthase